MSRRKEFLLWGVKKSRNGIYWSDGLGLSFIDGGLMTEYDGKYDGSGKDIGCCLVEMGYWLGGRTKVDINVVGKKELLFYLLKKAKV